MTEQQRMAYKKIFFFILLLSLLGVSCSDSYNDGRSDDPGYVTGDETRPATELDHWLRTTFTEPYNIQVKYRWDNSELDPYKTLTPPDVAKVQAVMDVVKRVWIDTYNAVADADFMKEYCPKQFVLVGSANYNFDGSRTIGTAEGGRKVVLFVVNDFEADNHEGVKELMHTVEHEFGHILHQSINYPAAFKEITSGRYTANWSSVSVAQARAAGFITPYAMASENEDFVEMIATMLVEGRSGYEKLLSCWTNASSRALLRRKEQIVVEYFREKYSIDFYALQTNVQDAINQLAPAPPVEEIPPVFDVWGFEKDSSSVKFDFSFYSYPAGFTSNFVADYNALQKKGYGLATYFRLFFTDENHVRLQLHYYTNRGGEREYFVANYNYDLVQEDGVTKFMYAYDADEDSRQLLVWGAYHLVEYFGFNQYQVEWERTSCPGSGWVGFYPVNSPNEGYTFGILGN
jgi:substrate import-associated zinc metallohydrolase lipoprotein